MKHSENDLESYLNDHLAGSSSAVSVLEELIEKQELEGEVQFFADLKNNILKNRELLQRLIALAGLEESTGKKIAGGITAGVSKLKLKMEGFEPGHLGMLEALELLCLGLHGQRLLWQALGKIAGWYPEWSEVTFSELELEAASQRDAVEQRRLECAGETLASVERRQTVLEMRSSDLHP